jgi:predicted N-formylglutamate amidohydrolase
MQPRASTSPGTSAPCNWLKSSQVLGATLLSANYSRLLIDLNRPRHAPDSIPAQSEIYQVPGNRELDEATREYRRQTLFKPFHARLQTLIDQRVAQGQAVRVVGIHSFTPVYYGQRARWKSACCSARPAPMHNG